MPTPARLATASRLASEPPAPKTRAAAFSRRSRLRIESARGLRAALRDRTAIGISLTPPLENGGCLRISLTTERRLEPPSVRAAGLPRHGLFDNNTDWSSRVSFSISLTVNGVKRNVELDDPRVTLLD